MIERLFSSALNIKVIDLRTYTSCLTALGGRVSGMAQVDFAEIHFRSCSHIL